jgi:hypothetical protein
VDVSEVSFGAVRRVTVYGIGAGEHNMLARDHAVELLCLAVEGGITFFGTVRTCGSSGKHMGRACVG